MRSVHECFHDSKLKFVKVLRFPSCHETEVLISFYCLRLFVEWHIGLDILIVVYIYLSKSTIKCQTMSLLLYSMQGYIFKVTPTTFNEISKISQICFRVVHIF